MGGSGTESQSEGNGLGGRADGEQSLTSPCVCLPLQANFFDEYQMEGVSPENNEICLEVIVENLARSLKTIQNAKSVKLKLTKKHCPCLTIAAELVRNGTAAEFRRRL